MQAIDLEKYDLVVQKFIEAVADTETIILFKDGKPCYIFGCFDVKKYDLAVEKAQMENIAPNNQPEVINQMPPKQSAAEFLLSMAGMFDSGIEDTSENVEAIVMDAILTKHERE